MTADVAVLGAGVSGLSAAVELARAGVRVTLVERSLHAGGRCSSFLHRESNDIVDNGQHLLVGAYTSTLRYLDLIGARGGVQSLGALSLLMFHPSRGLSSFRLLGLPRPFDAAAGVLSYRHIPFRERIAMLRIGTAIQSWNDDAGRGIEGTSVAAWLRARGQSDEACRSFWFPLSVAIMNDRPERSSAKLFARSLAEVFRGPASNSNILVATIGQSDLYGKGAIDVIQRSGGRCVFGKEVTGLQQDRDGTFEITLKGNLVLRAGSVISSLPPPALEAVLPEALRLRLALPDRSAFRASPIVSIHLWFDRDIMPDPLVGLIDRPLHWLFNRRQFVRQNASPYPGYVTGVISGADAESAMHRDRLVALMRSDLAAVYPDSADARCMASLVVKERRATYAPDQLRESIRPQAASAVAGFYLAGDWTATGLPATIEGAIRSGRAAADAVLGAVSAQQGGEHQLQAPLEGRQR